VAVYFEPGVDEVAITDGVHGLVGANHAVYAELTHRPHVRVWLQDHAINLGNSEQRATHWLLVDRATERVYVCDAASARDHVRAQILEDWAG
jgi:hypothetical protein